VSINFCTINTSSINAFCANRRAIVIDNLIRDKYTQFLGTNNSSISQQFVKLRPDLVQHVIDDLEPHQLQFEQPFITVTAELLGEVGTQQLEAAVQSTFVAAFDLAIGLAGGKLQVSAEELKIVPPWKLEEPEISVNITEFEI